MGILTIAGGVTAFIGASGGKVTAFNAIGTSPSTILQPAPLRVSLTFHNPGTQNLYVAPLTTVTGTALVPSLGALGGCFEVFPGGFLVITGECQQGWQAFAAANANNPLTVMESNI